MSKALFTQVLPAEAIPVTIYMEDAPVAATEGASVAAALLAAGFAATRTTALAHEPRGPHCLMGVCCECLVEIDGVANQQSCLIPVREGMRVRRQQGAPDFTPAVKNVSVEEKP